MGLMQKILLLCLLFIVCMALNMKAQSPQIDFKYDLKIVNDSIQIKVKILEGDGSYKYFLFQGDPLENGILLKEEEASLKKFIIIVEKKSNLYLCVASMSNGKQKSLKIVPLK